MRSPCLTISIVPLAVVAGIAVATMLSSSALAQESGAASSASPPAGPNRSFSSSVNTAGPIAPDKSHPLDLNAASEAELAALPGIGSERSKAIAAGRPYQSKDDLVRRKILPEADYARIKDLINVKRG